MFSYYGSKSKIAKHYPLPKEDKIIEPFCGAAHYSLYGNNWQKEVLLYDKYDIIVNLWKYLIQASEKDIMALPVLEYKESIDNHKYLTTEEKHLIGFCINQGSAQPKKTRQKFSGWNNNKKRQIMSTLVKIRHWKVELKDYQDIENTKACWFVDPPYQFGGKYYRHKKIDYTFLSKWVQSRAGQVIVCENSKANWLNFLSLVDIHGQKNNTTEVIWTNFNIGVVKEFGILKN